MSAAALTRRPTNHKVSYSQSRDKRHRKQVTLLKCVCKCAVKLGALQLLALGGHSERHTYTQMSMEICPQSERCLAVLKLTELSVGPLRDASSANILDKAQQPTAFQLEIQWRVILYQTIRFTVQV